MGSQPKTAEAGRDEIISAIADVGSVARSERDEQRNKAACWLDEQFIDGITQSLSWSPCPKERNPMRCMHGPNLPAAGRIPCWHDEAVSIPAEAVAIAKMTVLFLLAAAAEIGGAWLVWQSVREGKDWWWAGLGVVALGLYGFVATLQPDAHFGRILAAYGGVFVAGSLAWGMVFDGFRPDGWDIAGSVICLVGVAVIMFAPRSAA